MAKHPKPRFPITRVMCLLTGCLATLVGVAFQLSPEVILYRAAVSVAVAAVATYVASSIGQAFQSST
jgi:hypothetical protein